MWRVPLCVDPIKSEINLWLSETKLGRFVKRERSFPQEFLQESQRFAKRLII